MASSKTFEPMSRRSSWSKSTPLPEATRYHSLIVERETLPASLEVVAWTPEGEIMGLKHQEHETWGVQFHPESVLTSRGLDLMANFLTLCRQRAGARG